MKPLTAKSIVNLTLSRYLLTIAIALVLLPLLCAEDPPKIVPVQIPLSTPITLKLRQAQSLLSTAQVRYLLQQQQAQKKEQELADQVRQADESLKKILEESRPKDCPDCQLTEQPDGNLAWIKPTIQSKAPPAEEKSTNAPTDASKPAK